MARPTRFLTALLVTVLASLAGAGGASALEVATFNLHEGKGQARPLAPVIGWQETEVAQTPSVMGKLRRVPGYTTFFPAGDAPKRFSANAVPISFQKKTFDLVSSGSRNTHGGEAGVTPSRWVNWVVLKNKRTQKQFVFVNTHFISKAFTSKPDRRQRWNDHLAILNEQVTALAQQWASPVVVVGDFNRPAPSPIAGLTLDPWPGAGAKTPYDQIYVSNGVPAKPAVRMQRFGSDHFAFKAKVNL